MAKNPLENYRLIAVNEPSAEEQLMLPTNTVLFHAGWVDLDFKEPNSKLLGETLQKCFEKRGLSSSIVVGEHSRMSSNIPITLTFANDANPKIIQEVRKEIIQAAQGMQQERAQRAGQWALKGKDSKSTGNTEEAQQGTNWQRQITGSNADNITGTKGVQRLNDGEGRAKSSQLVQTIRRLTEITAIRDNMIISHIGASPEDFERFMQGNETRLTEAQINKIPAVFNCDSVDAMAKKLKGLENPILPALRGKKDIEPGDRKRDQRGGYIDGNDYTIELRGDLSQTNIQGKKDPAELARMREEFKNALVQCYNDQKISLKNLAVDIRYKDIAKGKQGDAHKFQIVMKFHLGPNAPEPAEIDAATRQIVTAATLNTRALAALENGHINLLEHGGAESKASLILTKGIAAHTPDGGTALADSAIRDCFLAFGVNTIKETDQNREERLRKMSASTKKGGFNKELSEIRFDSSDAASFNDKFSIAKEQIGTAARRQLNIIAGQQYSGNRSFMVL